MRPDVSFYKPSSRRDRWFFFLGRAGQLQCWPLRQLLAGHRFGIGPKRWGQAWPIETRLENPLCENMG